MALIKVDSIHILIYLIVERSISYGAILCANHLNRNRFSDSGCFFKFIPRDMSDIVMCCISASGYYLPNCGAHSVG